MNTAPHKHANPLARLGSGLQGMLRSRRRGTFLVLVVGTLAMLSIIMIVYVAVGNSDRRTSTAVVRRNRSNEIVDIFADYVGQVLADDVFASVRENAHTKFAAPISLPVDNLYSREAWDAPRTDWSSDSNVTDSTNDRYFRPFGVGDDPWLASTTPTWINFAPQSNVPTNTDKLFSNRADWLHISNIAPDGRFVNLVNLRNNFDAQPGSGPGFQGQRMSSGLTLVNPVNRNAARNTLWGESVDGSTRPAFFDSWQAGAFRPAKGPFPAPIARPDDPAYPPNQWADADGDGWLDSRWFEMVDARVGGSAVSPTTWRTIVPTDPNYRWVFAARIIDLSSLVNVNVATDLDANPNDPRTLTDERGTLVFDDTSKWQVGTQVLGRSPAEVDLRRLLTLRDFREAILAKAPAGAGSPPAPILDTDALAIADINPSNGAPVSREYRGGYTALRQPIATSQSVQDYSLYSSRRDTEDNIPGIIGTAPAIGNDINLGLGAYRSIRAAVTLGRAPGRFSNFAIAPLSIAARPLGQPNFRWESFASNAGPLDRPVYRAAPDGTYRPDAGFDFGLGFRSDALIELLTYRGSNDPRVTSVLEAAAGGRAITEFNTAPTPTTLAITFSPLRENRGIELEREVLAGANGIPTEASMLKAFTDVRQYLTTMSGARPIVSTINGSSVAAAFNPDRPASLSSSELSFQLTDNAGAPNIFKGLAAALMPGLPAGATRDSQLHLAWGADTNASAKSLRGLFYGHQGPMTALLTAAHLAANFDSGAKESTDDTRGRPYTLVLDETVQIDAAGRLPLDTANAAFESWRQHFPAWWLGNQFNLARPQASRGSTATDAVNRVPLATGTNVNDAPVPAVNIYGTGDAHPFLVAAATYSVFRDVSPTQTLVADFANADTENVPNPRGTQWPEITINGRMVDNNPDFLFRLVAVQVHNPHPSPIQLAGGFDGTTRFQVQGTQAVANDKEDFFYLRIGDQANSKFYVLAEVDEVKSAAGDAYTGEYTVKPVIIQPGETIVFYALSRDRRRIVRDRLNPSDITAVGQQTSPQFLEDWLTSQLGPIQATSFRRIQMLRADAATFGSSTPTASPARFSLDAEATGVLVPPADEEDTTVAIYRAIRMDSGSILNDSGATPNTVTNDRLCDRIRPEGRVIWDQTLQGSTPQPNQPPVIANRVTGLTTNPDLQRFIQREASLASNGPRRFGTDPEVDYNTRLTVALVSFVRRPNDPSGADLKPGQLPAWAIDPKDDASWYTTEMLPDPNRGTAPLKLTSSLLTDAVNSSTFTGRFAAFTTRNWNSLAPIFPDLTKRAGESGTSIKANLASTPFDTLRRELASNGLGYRSHASGAAKKVYQARPVDFLGVLAVGPYEAPLDQSGSPQTNQLKRWTTTAEALAMAMGYTNRPTAPTDWQAAGNNFGPLDFYYFDRFTTAGTPKLIYDAGYLRLDDFASVRFDASDRAVPTGSGAPIAGNILTMFRTAPDRFAGLTASTAGLVNINTAPIPVLRVLPLASPAQDEASSSDNASKPTLWPAVRGETADIAAQRSDFAAMIESYRDKIAVELRPGARDPGNLAATPTPFYSWFAPFIDRSSPSVLTGLQRQAPNSAAIGDPTNLPAQYVGARYWTSGIVGIREEAGFRSLAELLALRSVQVTPAALGAQAEGRDQPINIDFLGHQETGATATGTNILGVDNILELTADANGTVTGAKPLQFPNTQQDRLKVLAALAGSVTVRSDMYAAWFVIRGYARSDVADLADDQPMVPSIERRFLMLIDRSNVTRPGQKPRIVAMVELPL